MTCRLDAGIERELRDAGGPDAPCEKSPDARLISLVEPSGIEPLTS
jgi:hypothetical protein